MSDLNSSSGASLSPIHFASQRCAYPSMMRVLSEYHNVVHHLDFDHTLVARTSGWSEHSWLI